MSTINVLRSAGPLLKCSRVSNCAIIGRFMSSHGPRKMIITPTRYEWTQYKDHLNFYFWIGAIPLGLFTLYQNLFVGQAELADIPDDYIPKHWEYYKSPITRLIAKYFHEGIEASHERALALLYDKEQRFRDKKRMQKVKALMAERGDYQGWFYYPIHQDPVLIARESEKMNELVFGRP